MRKIYASVSVDLLQRMLNRWKQSRLTEGHCNKLLQLWLGTNFTDCMDAEGKYTSLYFNEIRQRLKYATTIDLITDLQRSRSFGLIAGDNAVGVESFFSPVYHTYAEADGPLFQGSAASLTGEPAGKNADNACRKEKGKTLTEQAVKILDSRKCNLSNIYTPSGGAVTTARAGSPSLPSEEERLQVARKFIDNMYTEGTLPVRGVFENLAWRLRHPSDRQGTPQPERALNDEQVKEVMRMLVHDKLSMHFAAQERFFHTSTEGRISWVVNFIKCGQGSRMLSESLRSCQRRWVKAAAAERTRRDEQRDFHPHSPHEWSNPDTQQRYYADSSGLPVSIPSAAPPRPSEGHTWNHVFSQWRSLVAAVVVNVSTTAPEVVTASDAGVSDASVSEMVASETTASDAANVGENNCVSIVFASKTSPTGGEEGPENENIDARVVGLSEIDSGVLSEVGSGMLPEVDSEVLSEVILKEKERSSEEGEHMDVTESEVDSEVNLGIALEVDSGMLPEVILEEKERSSEEEEHTKVTKSEVDSEVNLGIALEVGSEMLPEVILKEKEKSSEEEKHTDVTGSEVDSEVNSDVNLEIALKVGSEALPEVILKEKENFYEEKKQSDVTESEVDSKVNSEVNLKTALKLGSEVLPEVVIEEKENFYEEKKQSDVTESEVGSKVDSEVNLEIALEVGSEVLPEVILKEKEKSSEEEKQSEITKSGVDSKVNSGVNLKTALKVGSEVLPKVILKEKENFYEEGKHTKVTKSEVGSETVLKVGSEVDSGTSSKRPFPFRSIFDRKIRCASPGETSLGSKLEAVRSVQQLSSAATLRAARAIGHASAAALWVLPTPWTPFTPWLPPFPWLPAMPWPHRPSRYRRRHPLHPRLKPLQPVTPCP